MRLNIDLVGLKSKTKKITCSKSNIKRRSCSTSADWTNNYLKSRVCMCIICANFNQPFCFSLLSLWHKTTKKNRELYTHSVFFWHDNGTNRVFEQSECMTHYHEMTIPIARMYYKRKKKYKNNPLYFSSKLFVIWFSGLNRSSNALWRWITFQNKSTIFDFRLIRTMFRLGACVHEFCSGGQMFWILFFFFM